MSARGAVAAAALAAALAGCGVRDAVATFPGAADTVLARRGGTPAYCAGESPPVLLDGTCTGALSARMFARAACTCGPLSPPADLATDGFDSRVGPWAAGGAGADVGAAGGLSSGGLLQVGGSLVVSGSGAAAGTTLRVAGDLDVGGALGRPGSAVTVGGSARIGGDVDVASLTVAGTLTTPPGAALRGTISASSTAAAVVTVPSACPCGAAEAIDVAGLVAQHQATNDNASIGLAPDALAVVATPTTLSLPCGRFYLDRIQGYVSITLRATGRAALFVGSGLTVSGPLAIELDPGAELDLFVAGPVNLPASLRAGDPARPAALRVWIATGGAMSLREGAQWAANLYAPAADLEVSAPVDLYGAVTVRQVLNQAPLSIHYDRAIAAAAAACGR